MAEAFVAIGRELRSVARQVESLPLTRSEHARAARMAESAREALTEAMTSTSAYLAHVDRMRGRS